MPKCSAVALLILLFATACETRQSFEMRGRVAGFGDDGRTLIVEHEEVPDLMPAMTMPFIVRDTTGIADLDVRDAISFELTIAGDSSWIDELLLLPDTAVAEHPADALGSLDRASSAAEILEVGDRAPRVELITHADTTLRLAELQGNAVLMTFIYTRCPIPNFCPLMSRRFAELQTELDERYEGRVHLLSVSFDPSYDSPEVLRSYANRYADDLSNWTFATGDSAAVYEFAANFGVFYTDQADEIIHNLVTVLIGPDGQIRDLWRGNAWTITEVADSIDTLFRES